MAPGFNERDGNQASHQPSYASTPLIVLDTTLAQQPIVGGGRFVKGWL